VTFIFEFTLNKFEDYANTLDIPPVQDIEYQD
jgi:hypothetical protein